jgi:hypothetical protein
VIPPLAAAVLMLESPVATQMMPLEVAVPTLLHPALLVARTGPDTSV